MITESICRVLNVDANKIWNFISSSSTDPYTGIPILKELKKKADYGFFDSWHTLDHVMKELKMFETIASKKFVVAFDDAYYAKRHTNDSYINMLRSKLKLRKIKPPKIQCG